MSLSYKDQPVVYTLTSLVLLILALFIGVKAWNAGTEHRYIGKPSTVRDTITVDGSGKVSAKPTLASVRFAVVTQAGKAAQAQAQNTDKMNTVIAAMKVLGIKADDLQTSGYSLSPNYDYNRQPYQILGYSVTQTLTVKVRDFDKVGQVLEQGVGLGINQVDAVSFTIDEPASTQEEARSKAIENAKQKAEKLADELGVQIVRVVSFSENGGGQPVYYDRAIMAAPTAVGSAPVPTIEPGTQEVSSNVSVTYEIR